MRTAVPQLSAGELPDGRLQLLPHGDVPTAGIATPPRSYPGPVSHIPRPGIKIYPVYSP